MIKKEVFDELMNQGLVTNVGLDSEKYNDLADLQNNGYANVVGAENVYTELNNESATNSVEEDIVVDDNNDNTVEE